MNIMYSALYVFHGFANAHVVVFFITVLQFVM